MAKDNPANGGKPLPFKDKPYSKPKVNLPVVKPVARESASVYKPVKKADNTEIARDVFEL